MPKKKYVPIRRYDRNSVGRVVARIRLGQALSQEDLVGRAAVISWVISRDVVKRIESGEREVTDIELRKLGKALRVPPAVLLE